jgi:hypothetical protein
LLVSAPGLVDFGPADLALRQIYRARHTAVADRVRSSFVLNRRGWYDRIAVSHPLFAFLVMSFRHEVSFRWPNGNRQAAPTSQRASGNWELTFQVTII